MKTAKKGILFAGALAALVGLAAGCGSGEQFSSASEITAGRFNYEPEETEYKRIEPGAEAREAVLQTCLDNLAVSGILDPNIVPELRNPSYAFGEENDEWTGSYYRWNDGIDLFYRDFGESLEEQLRKNDLCATAFHEFAHYFYEHKLTQDQRETFRQRVLWLKKCHDDIQAQDGIGIEDFGFTLDSFRNIADFLSLEHRYREKYGELFEECFYGKEAFAYLVEREVMLKLGCMDILSVDDSEESTLPRDSLRYLLIKRERQITRESLGVITHIPAHVLEFYEKFLHPRYFKPEINSVEPDSN